MSMCQWDRREIARISQKLAELARNRLEIDGLQQLLSVANYWTVHCRYGWPAGHAYRKLTNVLLYLGAEILSGGQNSIKIRVFEAKGTLLQFTPCCCCFRWAKISEGGNENYFLF